MNNKKIFYNDFLFCVKMGHNLSALNCLKNNLDINYENDLILYCSCIYKNKFFLDFILENYKFSLNSLYDCFYICKNNSYYDLCESIENYFKKENIIMITISEKMVPVKFINIDSIEIEQQKFEHILSELETCSEDSLEFLDIVNEELKLNLLKMKLIKPCSYNEKYFIKGDNFENILNEYKKIDG